MTRGLAIAMLALLLAAAAPPRPLAAIGVDEHVGDHVPGDLVFASTDGNRVRTDAVFARRRPTLLVLTYVRCKMLCSLVLRGTIAAVNAMSLRPGEDYDVVLVSIDPSEDAASAAARLRDIGRNAGGTTGWTYLTGTESQIRALADALGFRYALDPQTDQFAHPAVIFVLTPDGRIARYLHGVAPEPRLVETALREAARGVVGAKDSNESVLGCFLYDPAARAHRTLVERYLRAGGALVVLSLATLIISLVVADARRRRST